ncbi:MAG TPA: tRNA pseudouridine(38-40) synthase TruA [Candidatus Thermoplasmatota archaeon]|nr:tRNA pseudouridine(38-40) synthase TruA [Candidatus Thermoplasmatota archaeon]
MRRWAVKVAYDGTRFHGSQVQPGVRTVHAEVARALEQLGGDPATLRWAGRTDAGVSAAGNVVALSCDLPPESLLPGLTFRMEDAWAWAAAPVPDSFEPRHARRRRYRYHLRSDLPEPALQRAMSAFVGMHDFTAFCRLEPGVDPRRTVESVGVRRRGDFLVVDVVGHSFLWNQVRRMVEAGRRQAAGELHEGAIRAALLRGEPAEMGTAPPEPLLLVDVEYDGVAFEPARGDVFERLHRRREALDLARAVTGDILDAAGARQRHA